MTFEAETTEEHERRITRCRTCNARIIFLPTAAGRNMPVDADTVEPEHQLFDVDLGHENHWATCPGADHHRKARR